MQLTRRQRRRFYPALTPKEEADFWQHITQGDDAVCWPWYPWLLGTFTPCPAFYLRPRWRVNAIRIAYWLWYGVQPGLSNVLHSCKNPRCCNPLHLYLRAINDKGQ
jgi:hypothetical protein